MGTDGTTASHAAAQWAAREAQRRGLPLRIVHAFDWHPEAARYDAGTEYIDVARQLADAVVAAARDQARAVAPGLRVELDTLIGDPAPQVLLGRLAEDLPEIAELDLNPVLAGPAGVVAVDAKLRLAPVGTEPDPALRRLRPAEDV